MLLILKLFGIDCLKFRKQNMKTLVKLKSHFGLLQITLAVKIDISQPIRVV